MLLATYVAARNGYYSTSTRDALSTLTITNTQITVSDLAAAHRFYHFEEPLLCIASTIAAMSDSDEKVKMAETSREIFERKKAWLAAKEESYIICLRSNQL